ncbi:MAG: hypothetical protein JXL97_06305 [Bacteroidales bacterium]|nr:hypothetical protein [Bacteroidales bacterium]
MAKKGIIIIILFFGFFTSKSQTLNYLSVDKQTYEKYLAQDWKGVIELGKESKKAGIDFYYLNVRMGVAYFEQGKYLLSILLLEKAIETNPDDEFVKLYLYYDYLYSGLENQSLTVYSSMKPKTKNEIKITSKKLKDLELSISTSPNSSLLTLENTNYLENDAIIAYSYIEKNTTNAQIGLNYQLKNNIFLFHDFSLLKSSYSFVKQSTIQDNLLLDMSLTQLKYYGKFSIDLRKNFIFSANYNLVAGYIQDISEQLLYDGTTVNFGRWASSGVVNVPFSQLSMGISVSKQFKILNIKPHIDLLKTYENLNIYSGLDLIISPLANSDLYFKISSSYNFLSEEDLPLVASGEAGFRLWKVYLYGFYYYGNIHNFVENDGYFLYNSSETQNNLFGGGITFPTKNKSFYISVNQSNYDYTYTNVFSDQTEIQNTKSFTKLFFKGGIKWKF